MGPRKSGRLELAAMERLFLPEYPLRHRSVQPGSPFHDVYSMKSTYPLCCHMMMDPEDDAALDDVHQLVSSGYDNKSRFSTTSIGVGPYLRLANSRIYSAGFWHDVVS